MVQHLALGKTPARPDAVRLQLQSVMREPLITPPRKFDAAPLIGNVDWDMLGNDRYGDCVWAGADHETMAYMSSAHRDFRGLFTTETALGDYAESTGFNRAVPASDQGTDMEEAAKYRRKSGIRDSLGSRHSIEAYATVDGIDYRGGAEYSAIDELVAAAYTFGPVGLGILFPSYAMDQFDADQVWSYRSNPTIEGGHYVSLVGRTSAHVATVITWGRRQRVSYRFLAHFLDSAIVYLSPDSLDVAGRNARSLDLDALRAYIGNL